MVVLVAAILVALFTIDSMNWPEISLAAVNSEMLLLAFLAQIGFWVMVSIGWSKVLRFTSDTRIELGDAFAQIGLLLVGKYLPGKVWGMVARGSALRQHNMATKDIVKSTFTEQLVSIHAGVVVGGLSLFFIIGGGAGWIMLILSLSSIVLIPIFNKLITRVFVSLVYLYKKTRVDFSFDIKFSDYLVTFLIYILAWVMIGSILLFLSIGFLSLEFNIVESAEIISQAAVGMLAGYFALFAPGGIGIRESVISFSLSDLMTVDEAIALVVIYRVWLTISDVIAGCVALVWVGVVKKS